jgi:hypothetical protein
MVQLEVKTKIKLPKKSVSKGGCIVPMNTTGRVSSAFTRTPTRVALRSRRRWHTIAVQDGLDLTVQAGHTHARTHTHNQAHTYTRRAFLIECGQNERTNG